MSDPIIAIVKLLMERGMSPETALDTAGDIAQILKLPPRVSGSTEEQRKKWRLKKARQRETRSTVSGEKVIRGITTDIVNSQYTNKKEPKPKDVQGDIPQDDWPQDYVDQFWKAFPPYRRQSKRKVGEKLARIRAYKVTWQVMFDGLQRYAATDPGQYACAPIVWLNDERWDRVYGPNGGNGNGHTHQHRQASSAETILAAARRRAGGQGQHHAAPGGDQVFDPGAAGSGGSSGSNAPTFDLEPRAGADGYVRGPHR